MLDLCVGGAAVLLNNDIPVLALVTVEFTLNNSNPSVKDNNRKIAVNGEVRYNRLVKTKEFRVGINFTRISNSDKSFIAEFIEWERVRLPSG